MGEHGHPRVSREEYLKRQASEDNPLSDLEIEDYQRPGPFSYIDYLKYLMEPGYLGGSWHHQFGRDDVELQHHYCSNRFQQPTRGRAGPHLSAAQSETQQAYGGGGFCYSICREQPLPGVM